MKNSPIQTAPRSGGSARRASGWARAAVGSPSRRPRPARELVLAYFAFRPCPPPLRPIAASPFDGPAIRLSDAISASTADQYRNAFRLRARFAAALPLTALRSATVNPCSRTRIRAVSASGTFGSVIPPTCEASPIFGTAPEDGAVKMRSAGPKRPGKSVSTRKTAEEKDLFAASTV